MWANPPSPANNGCNLQRPVSCAVPTNFIAINQLSLFSLFCDFPPHANLHISRLTSFDRPARRKKEAPSAPPTNPSPSQSTWWLYEWHWFVIAVRTYNAKKFGIIHCLFCIEFYWTMWRIDRKIGCFGFLLGHLLPSRPDPTGRWLALSIGDQDLRRDCPARAQCRCNTRCTQHQHQMVIKYPF